MINSDVKIRPFLLVGCVALLALAACSDDPSDPVASAPITTDAPEPTTTTEAAATTTTILATTTTAAPVTLTLRNGGLGPFDFGADPAAVIAGITEQFGAPASDVADDYPDPTGGGYFTNDEFTFNFIAPFGRTVCWTLGLCANFGGVDSTTTTFVGWRYEGDAASTLATEAGLTIGSRLSEHPEIIEPLYPCYNGDPGPGYDGQSWIGEARPLLTITFRSEGIPFTIISGDVSGTPGPIPPADVTFVKRLMAGENPYPLDNYCG
ncbi:MAG: hypothetical protein HY826_06265 [Actinobacteria bacterium]|nr:hypothetical protein [Actinomycetota bacterium]